MALKATLKTLEGLSPDIAAEYKKDPDGEGFVLDVDGSDLKSQVREFRTNNVDLTKQLEQERKDRAEEAKKYKGVDLEKYKAGQTLMAQIQDENERKLIGEGKFEEVYSGRSEKMVLAHVADMEAKGVVINGLEATNSTLRNSLGSMKIEQSLGAVLNKAGAKPRKSAMVDIMARTHQTFSVDDQGEMQPLVNGQLLRGPKGEPLTMAEHIDAMSKDAPHLFESGGGGGAGGSGDVGGARTATGKIRVDRKDSLMMVKYHKEIGEGKVEFYES